MHYLQDDHESSSGMTFLSQSSKTPQETLLTKRLHSWAMLRTWLNRELAKEIVAACKSGTAGSTLSRFMLPPNTMSTELLTEQTIYHRGEKMQNKVGARAVGGVDQNKLANSCYFVFGLPRIRPSSFSHEEIDITSHANDDRSTIVNAGITSDVGGDISMSRRKEQTESSDLRRTHGIQNNTRRQNTEETSNYWESRLGKNPVTRNDPSQEEDSFYFGFSRKKEGGGDDRFGKSFTGSSFGKSKKEDDGEDGTLQRPSGAIGASQLRQSKREGGFSNNPRDDTYLKQSKRQTADPRYLGGDQENEYATHLGQSKRSPRGGEYEYSGDLRRSQSFTDLRGTKPSDGWVDYEYSRDLRRTKPHESPEVYGYAKDLRRTQPSENREIYGYARDLRRSQPSENREIYGYARDLRTSKQADNREIYGYARDLRTSK